MKIIFRLRYEISFLILSLTISALVFLSASGLPDPSYEPMGAAAFPKGIAAIAIFLIALKACRIFVAKKQKWDVEDDEETKLSFFKSFCMFMLFIAFVVLINFFDVRFWVSAFLFMLLATFFLKRPNGLRSCAVQCVALIGFSLVLDYLVIDVLYFNF